MDKWELYCYIRLIKAICQTCQWYRITHIRHFVIGSFLGPFLARVLRRFLHDGPMDPMVKWICASHIPYTEMQLNLWMSRPLAAVSLRFNSNKVTSLVEDRWRQVTSRMSNVFLKIKKEQDRTNWIFFSTKIAVEAGRHKNSTRAKASRCPYAASFHLSIFLYVLVALLTLVEF